MKYGIIRGIWGNETASRRRRKPPITYHRILEDVIKSQSEAIQADMVYCIGKQNHEFLTALGIDSCLVDNLPWLTPRLTDSIDQHGMVRYGANTFWHKLIILERALQDFDAVVWIDYHMTFQQKELPPKFWERLNAGPSFQASLSKQRSSTHAAGWRAWHPGKSGWHVPEMNLVPGGLPERLKQARLIPQGAWMYIRGLKMVWEFLEIQAKYPRWMDQQVYAYWLDRHNGADWMGVDEYIRRGHNTPAEWYNYSNLLVKPQRDDAYWVQE